MQQNFDPQKLMKLARSPAGQQLMTMLTQSGSTNLEKAAAMASAGNLEQAKEPLSSLLADPKIKALLEQLEGQL